MGFLEGWPPEAIATLIGLALTNLVTGFRAFFRLRAAADATTYEMHKLGWTEAASRGETIDTLRRLLDRGRRREGALATGIDLLVFVLPDDLSERQRETVARVRELFESALVHSGEQEGSES